MEPNAGAAEHQQQGKQFAFTSMPTDWCLLLTLRNINGVQLILFRVWLILFPCILVVAVVSR